MSYSVNANEPFSLGLKYRVKYRRVAFCRAVLTLPRSEVPFQVDVYLTEPESKGEAKLSDLKTCVTV